MAKLFHVNKEPQYVCWDRKYYTSYEEQSKVMGHSKTVYVGNLSFFTTETQLYETFSLVGPVKRVIMGLNSITKQPCGFCFVEYYTREHTMACLNYISGTVCDDRIIRCDLDAGYKPGRQFGRGQSGGQVRDERRQSFDSARYAGGGMNIHAPLSGSKRGRYNDNNNSGAIATSSTQLMVDLSKSLSSSRGPPPPSSLPHSLTSAATSVEEAMAATTVHEESAGSGGNNDYDEIIERRPTDEDDDENAHKRSRR